MRNATSSINCGLSPQTSRPHATPSASSTRASGSACSTGCSRLVLLTVVALVTMVSGCGTPRTQVLRPDPPRPDLLTPCRRPPPATDDQVKTLVANHLQAMELYDDCAIRQAELAGWAQTVTTTVTEPMWWEFSKWRKK